MAKERTIDKVTPEHIVIHILDSINLPVILLDKQDFVIYTNHSAELFFQKSTIFLKKCHFSQLLLFDHTLLPLIHQVRRDSVSILEYPLEISSTNFNDQKLVDVFLYPVPDLSHAVTVVFREKSIAKKFNRHIIQKESANFATHLSSLFAHEIKNPLSSIRGAAQLLETTVSHEDRSLMKLIQEETDRIVTLVNKMESLAENEPQEYRKVNIHLILDRVKMLAQNGFAQNIHFIERYDPSLPPILAHHDQLIQLFLNLVKNAAEAIGQNTEGKIILGTAYRPGIHLVAQGNDKYSKTEKIALPLEFSVEDNGSGIAKEITPYIFDPFITTKAHGSGLGLALVAKIVHDHNGIIEFETGAYGTIFRIFMPMIHEDKDPDL